LTIEGQARRGGFYRAEIDGLRAIAVLAVMGYHAGFPGLSGGYVGVDVFFVISGYLITGIILRECEAGTFSLASFWERRARRILPALFLVLAACLVPAILVLPPAMLESFGASLGASVLSAANLFFWRRTGGYFDMNVDSMPLIHLWSLGVEEQFYLLYPPLLLLVWRKARSWLKWLIPLGLLISLALSEAVSRLHPGAAFFLLPTRGWELLAGAALAIPGTALGSLGVGRYGKLLPLFGLALIAGPVFLYDAQTRFPGLPAVPPALGAALVIRFATPGTPAGRVLASPPLVALGLVSYGAYLWHQPLLVFARICSLDELNGMAKTGLLVAAFGLAYLSWRFVELPFRRRSFLSRRRLVVLALLVGAALAASGGYLWKSRGMPDRLPPPTRALARLSVAVGTRMERCLSAEGRLVPPGRACLAGKAGPVRIALLGDSHASASFAGVAAAMERRHERAILLSSPGCPARLGPASPGEARDPCQAFYGRAFSFLRARRDIDTVILASRWTANLEGSAFDNGEGGVERTPRLRRRVRSDSDKAAMGRDFRAAVETLLAMGKHVVLVYPIPEAGWDVPDYLVEAALRHVPVQPPLSTSYARFRERNGGAYRQLDAIGPRAALTRLYPEKALCNTILPGRCLLQYGDAPLYLDSHHVSPNGARLIFRQLDGVLPAAPAGRPAKPSPPRTP
jgi:peptidoglycan/LPS O-acetylase OafA/YrhL